MGNIDYHITPWYMQPVQEERGRKRENYFLYKSGWAIKEAFDARERDTEENATR